MKFIDKLEEWIGGTLFMGMFIVLIAQILQDKYLEDH